MNAFNLIMVTALIATSPLWENDKNTTEPVQVAQETVTAQETISLHLN